MLFFVSNQIISFVCLLSKTKTNLMSLKNIFAYIGWWFKTNVEISLENSNNMHIKAPVYLNIERMNKVNEHYGQNEEWSNISSMNVYKKDNFKKIFYDDVVVLDYKEKKVLEQYKEILENIKNKREINKIYTIIHDNNNGEVIRLFKELLYAQNVIAFLIHRPIFELVFCMNNHTLNENKDFARKPAPGLTSNNYYMGIDITKTYWYMVPISMFVCLLMLLVTNHACLTIINKIATLEPDFDNFTIANTKNTTFEEYKQTKTQKSKSLPREITAIEDKCVICHDEFEASSSVRELTCQHAFHTECIDKWLLSRQHYCPVCRKAVTIEEN